jgi:quercetin dioxygenase-like cupin family protein
MAIRVFHRDGPHASLPMIASDARLIVWPGTGAETANMNYVSMEPGEQNVPHVHETSEDTIMILSGRGTVADLTNGRELEFQAGQVIHVPPAVQHQVRADRGTPVVSAGGPCPADRALLRRAGLLPDAPEQPGQS